VRIFDDLESVETSAGGSARCSLQADATAPPTPAALSQWTTTTSRRGDQGSSVLLTGHHGRAAGVDGVDDRGAVDAL